MKIAISGKGGVGKTTIAASIAHSYNNKGFQVYAIDADPDANLAYMLGIKEEIKPLIELKEVITEKIGREDGLYSLNPEVDDVVEKYAINKDGIKFLQMGGLKQASSSCYCRENSFLRSIIDNLLFERDEIVILDMGAGIEHLTRGTSRGVDMMLIVCEPSNISINTAKNIRKLAQEAGVPEIKYIANKIRTEKDKKFLLSKGGDNFLTMIDYNTSLQQGNLNDNPPLLSEEIFNINEYLQLIE